MRGEPEGSGTSVAAPSKSKTRARVPPPLSAAEQRQLAEHLSAAHADMELWRVCKRKACGRRRRCCDDVNSCGTRRSPKAWAWVHEVLGAIRSGTARRAAVRAADRRARPERVKVKFGFGDPPFVMLEKKDDGTWGRIADYPPPSPVELQLRRVRGRGSRWLREAGQGVGERRLPVPARASVGEQ
jgi:hypothetical protein